MANKKSFLQRWLQRKAVTDNERLSQQHDKQGLRPEQGNPHQRKQQTGAEAKSQADSEGENHAQTNKQRAEQSPQLKPQHEPLPDPDTIEDGGSFACFMDKQLDPQIQQQALSRLWRQPQYQQLDGLEQCDQDFSNQPKLTPSQVDKVFKQVYQCLLADEPDEKANQDQHQRTNLQAHSEQQSHQQNAETTGIDVQQIGKSESDVLPKASAPSHVNAPCDKAQTLTLQQRLQNKLQKPLVQNVCENDATPAAKHLPTPPDSDSTG